MLPKELYREDFDGCAFDNVEDAQTQAIATAAYNLIVLLTQNEDSNYTADSEIIQERIKEIKKAMTDMNTAFAGNKVHVYKLNSL